LPGAGKAAGAHIIGVKDMAGLLKPLAAKRLVKALREATDLPIHFHTHDTSGIAAATVLAAVEAASTRSTPRWTRFPASRRSPASARSSRR
jgi:pyruvate carboxylase